MTDKKRTTVKVKFRQLSSGVTATVSFEESGGNVDKDETLKKAKELYSNAEDIAKQMSMRQL